MDAISRSMKEDSDVVVQVRAVGRWPLYRLVLPPIRRGLPAGR